MRCPDCDAVEIFSIPKAGNGKCSHCHGDGKKLLSGLNEGIMGTPLYCDFCDGSGTCQTCGGSGVIDDSNDESEGSRPSYAQEASAENTEYSSSSSDSSYGYGYGTSRNTGYTPGVSSTSSRHGSHWSVILIILIAVGLFIYYVASSTNQPVPPPAKSHPDLDARRSPPTQLPSPSINISRSKLAEITAPIQNVFSAWSMLNYGLYASQWAENATYSSGGKVFNARSLMQMRKQDFARYRSVSTKYHIISVDLSPDRQSARVQVEYAMRYQHRDGKTTREEGVRETYILGYSRNARRWLIIRNTDHLE